MCEPISDTVWFLCRRKSYLIEYEHSLDNSERSWKFFKCYEPYQGQALRFFLVAYINACIAEQKITWNSRPVWIDLNWLVQKQYASKGSVNKGLYTARLALLALFIIFKAF